MALLRGRGNGLGSKDWAATSRSMASFPGLFVSCYNSNPVLMNSICHYSIS
jgi:hypothetical protein